MNHIFISDRIPQYFSFVVETLSKIAQEKRLNLRIKFKNKLIDNQMADIIKIDCKERVTKVLCIHKNNTAYLSIQSRNALNRVTYTDLNVKMFKLGAEESSMFKHIYEHLFLEPFIQK